METLTLQAQSRTGNPAETRAQKLVPGIVYGHGFEPQQVAVDAAVLKKFLTTTSESTLIDLSIGSGQPVKVLLKDLQRDPVSDAVIHIDFHAIRMDEKLTATIELVFVGEAPAIKMHGGTLVTNRSHLEVSCLPAALVPSITIDLSVLKSFEEKIRVSDVKIPEGMEVLTKLDDVVVLVAPPRTDAELAELDKAVEADASQVEVVKKEKKEEEAEGDEKAEEKK